MTHVCVRLFMSVHMVGSPAVRVSCEDPVLQGLGGHPSNRKQALPTLPVVIGLVDVSCHAEIWQPKNTGKKTSLESSYNNRLHNPCTIDCCASCTSLTLSHSLSAQCFQQLERLRWHGVVMNTSNAVNFRSKQLKKHSPGLFGSLPRCQFTKRTFIAL